MDRLIKVALIGFGRMGRFYFNEMQKSGKWDIAYICDTDPRCRDIARTLSPHSRVVEDEDEVFADDSVEVVGLFTLADSRGRQIEKAVERGKHILCEKPIAESIEKEWRAVKAAEHSPVFSAVNLYLRNSWYHNYMKEWIDRGEIGELAVLRICHLTPGLAPGEGHE